MIYYNTENQNIRKFCLFFVEGLNSISLELLPITAWITSNTSHNPIPRR